MTRTLTTSFEKNRVAERWLREKGLKPANHRGAGYNSKTGTLIISIDVDCSDEQWNELKRYVREN